MASAVTAHEIELEVRRLDNDQDPWTRRLSNGAQLFVRLMPRKHFGVWYLVWVEMRRPGHVWCSRKLTAMTTQTASKKARSLVSKYGIAKKPWELSA